MNITHYIFAFYVFILVCAVIWLYGRVTHAEKKNDKSSYEKEQRLFKMYQNIEDMLSSFEEYTEEAKAEIDERLKQAEALIGKMESAESTGNAPARTRKTVSSAAVAEKKKTKSASEKRQNRVITQYIDKGMDKEEIAKALGISSREVALVMEIKKMNNSEGKA